MLIHNSILLAGPIDTLKALFRLIRTSDFWMSILKTSVRICAGFLTGILSGILLAFVSYKSRLIRDFLSPLVSAVKSVPVASFVVLVLIWSGTELTSFIISTLVVFPIIYLNTLEGLSSIDPKLIEMAKIFRMRKSYRLRYIFLDGLKPFLSGSLSIAAGMSWKSGIAAEVISRPAHSIGNGVYMSKIYLMTEDLFAWTVMAVLLAFISEKIVRFILGRIFPK